MQYPSNRTSSAYDYDDMMSHFSRTPAAPAEAPEVQRQAKPQLQVITGGRAKARGLFRPRPFLTLMGVLMGAGLVLHSYMQVSVVTSQVAEARTELVEQQAIQTALLTKQEYTLSDEAIEAYAEEAGMFKLDNSQVEWYEMSNPDKVEVSGTGVKISGMFESLMHSFSAALAYLK